jgi:hypothetical protein
MKTSASSYLLVGTAMSLGLAGSGCSAIFTRGPEVRLDQMTADTPVDCSSSVAPPILDIALIGTHFAGGIFSLAQPDEVFGGSSDARTAVIIADFGLAALHLASAIYGYSTLASCREAEAQLRVLVEARDKNPAPKGVGKFTFGMTREAAAQECTAAGHAWISDDAGDRCDDTPAGSGQSRSVQLKFGQPDLWSINTTVPGGAAWSRTFFQLREGLQTSYGTPLESHLQVPAGCAPEAQAVACAERGEMRIATEWRWPNGTRVVLQVYPMKNRLVIGMLYEKALSTFSQARAQAAEEAATTNDAAYWTAWLAAHGATACRDALPLLTSDSQCTGAACRAPFLLSSAYLKNCEVDTDTRISLTRMRRRWREVAGTTISECLKETYGALTDPAKAATLQQRCSNEGTTEAALRDAARRSPPQPNPPAPGTAP